MRDPWEGRDATGAVVTGAHLDRISPAFAGVIKDASHAIVARFADLVHSVHVYGSVATGQAIVGRSDLDLLVVAHAPLPSTDLQDVLKPIAAAHPQVRDIGGSVVLLDRFRGAHPAARADRCFLHHYTVLVHGPHPLPWHPPCIADQALAEGFGALALSRLHDLAANGPSAEDDVPQLGRHLLMAAATLLSIQDGEWSTDRWDAVQRIRRRDPAAGDNAKAVWTVADSQGSRFETPTDDDGPRVQALAAWLQDHRDE
jgi:predicted nucleotidyltransferase